MSFSLFGAENRFYYTVDILNEFYLEGTVLPTLSIYSEKLELTPMGHVGAVCPVFGFKKGTVHSNI